jgi:hypothetical protein
MISTKEFAGHRTGTRPRPSADTATRGCVRCCSTGKRVRLVTGRALDKPYPVQPKALFISHRYPRYFKSLAQLTPSESVRVSDRIIEICEDSALRSIIGKTTATAAKEESLPDSKKEGQSPSDSKNLTYFWIP